MLRAYALLEEYTPSILTQPPAAGDKNGAAIEY